MLRRGRRARRHASAGAILVDHTTASAEVAREIADGARRAGVGFLDAPVSGGQAGAENGKLTVMVGGEPTPSTAAKPVIDCVRPGLRR